MLIRIEYESSWRNSFLDGSNDEPIPSKGRKYIASGKGLTKSENYIPREVEKSTVMGILNRLIGDQRKLYQAREDEVYYFKEIESLVTYKDIPKDISSELVYLRNMSGNFDENLFSGMIKANDKMFTSEYSKAFWGVLELDLDEVISFIINAVKIQKDISLDPFYIVNKFEKIKKLKPVDESDELLKAIKILENNFNDISTYRNDKKKIKILEVYCSALYLQKDRLSKEYDVSALLTKTKTIKGFSKKNFTTKDFMAHITTGGKKIAYGNPYIVKKFEKGVGKTTSMLKKVNGILEITLKINEDKAEELEEHIENAGVSTFYLGKKGLAYVTYIDTREED